MKASAFIATSLDGFIARGDGSLDWLDKANSAVPEGEDLGYRSFISAVDALIMGRKSYEKVLSFGQWPYEAMPVVVLSRSEMTFPAGLRETVTHSSESPQELLERLSNEGVKHVYVDGGITIQRFLSAGLIDEITVTIIPVLLGSGIPLFGPLDGDIELIHLQTNAYDFGFVQTTYSLKKTDRATR